jgi:hypothetical protein
MFATKQPPIALDKLGVSALSASTYPRHQPPRPRHDSQRHLQMNTQPNTSQPSKLLELFCTTIATRRWSVCTYSLVLAESGNSARCLASPALKIAVSLFPTPVLDSDAGSDPIISRSGRSLQGKRVYILVLDLLVCAKDCSVEGSFNPCFLLAGLCSASFPSLSAP